MNSRVGHWLSVVCVGAALWFGNNLAGAAENFREYAGMFDINDVIKSGGSVQLTLTFILLNPTNKNVNDAVITVLSTARFAKPIGKFGVIEKLPGMGRAKVTETFTLPKSEYARWEAGTLPSFQLQTTGEAGVTTAGIESRRVMNTSEESGT